MSKDYRRQLIHTVLKNVIGKDIHAKQAYHALRKRKLSKVAAIDEISRALLGVLWEVANEKLPIPDLKDANGLEEWMRRNEPRWSEVMRRIAEGETATDIWPE